MLLLGNALELLKDINNESVDCCITSPPYYGLRDYKTDGIIWDDSDCKHEWNNQERYLHRGTTQSPKLTDGMITEGKTNDSFCSKCSTWKGQLGLEPTFDLYLDHLIQIFNQVKRVLKKEGSCWVVMGDTYNGSANGAGDKNLTGKCKSTKGVTKFKLESQDLPDKSMMMIPERFAIKMVDNGWILRNKIIWYKPNCMPSSAKDRFTVDYEHILFFVKSKRYYFKTQYEPLKDPEDDIRRTRQIRQKRQNKFGGFNTSVQCANAVYNDEITQQWRPNPLGRIKRTVWKIPPKPFPDAHFAVFPEELVLQCLDAGCPPCGQVIDPFSGAGTVYKVALQTFRKPIGIEINPSYIEITKNRVKAFLANLKMERWLSVDAR